MLRNTRVFQASLVALAAAASVVPAHAAPFAKMFHLHPKAASTPTGLVCETFHNNMSWFRDVQVLGHVYTIPPHGSMTIKAPAGTAAYATADGLGHRKGDVLFAVAPEENGRTVFFN